MDKFQPDDDEKIHIEGFATYIKSGMNVFAGYAFLTSKRLAFAASENALSNALNSTPYDDNVLFTIDIADIQDVQEGKHGLTKKTDITTRAGDVYSMQFNPHEKWLSLLKSSSTLGMTASSDTDNDNDGNDWYYHDSSGNRVGPVPSPRMRQFIKNNHTIYRTTKVWREGMAEWKKAEETELSRLFEGPPPLIGTDVDNTFVWILAFAPIIGINLQVILATLFHTRESRFWLITIGLNILLAILDERKLTAAGHNPRALGLGPTWLVPVYLYKRAKALKQSMSYFIVWIIMFVILILN